VRSRSGICESARESAARGIVTRRPPRDRRSRRGRTRHGRRRPRSSRSSPARRRPRGCAARASPARAARRRCPRIRVRAYHSNAAPPSPRCGGASRRGRTRRGEQVVTLDVGREPPRELSHYPLDERQVRVDARWSAARSQSEVSLHTGRSGFAEPPPGSALVHRLAHVGGFLTHESGSARRADRAVVDPDTLRRGWVIFDLDTPSDDRTSLIARYSLESRCLNDPQWVGPDPGSASAGVAGGRSRRRGAPRRGDSSAVPDRSESRSEVLAGARVINPVRLSCSHIQMNE